MAQAQRGATQTRPLLRAMRLTDRPNGRAHHQPARGTIASARTAEHPHRVQTMRLTPRDRLHRRRTRPGARSHHSAQGQSAAPLPQPELDEVATALRIRAPRLTVGTTRHIRLSGVRVHSPLQQRTTAHLALRLDRMPDSRVSAHRPQATASARHSFGTKHRDQRLSNA